jgi:quinohemoprotein ethanol dehydrogenase
MMNRRHPMILAILLALGAAACSVDSSNDRPRADVTPADVDDAVLESAGERAGSWLTHGRDYAETRFSPLTGIHEGNVDRLGLAWTFATRTERGLEATPLVAGGVLYATGSWSVVYAVDARTGEELWFWDPEVDRALGAFACCDVVNRGVALYKGKVYAGIFDGRLVALDAGTGDVVWETQSTDPALPYTVTGAPRVVQGRVIIGNGGAEYGVRGYVSAYDAETGELAWRTYTVPGNPADGFESEAMKMAAGTWTGEWWTMGGGGTVWDSMAYDPRLDLLYVGVGNGTPWNRLVRSPGGGDNLFLASILALRPSTGELVWHYQTTPGETWDYTATQHMILADLDIDGEQRQVLMQAPKNGFFYVLDRATGELISAEPFVPLNWATHVDRQTGRPVEIDGARYEHEPFMQMPGPLGGHNWHPMSFNPHTGLVYIPAQEPWSLYVHDPDFEFREGIWNVGVIRGAAAALSVSLPAPTGHLLAWDPVAQQERWRAPYGDMWNGGTLTTAGNLVFQGTSDGRFIAYQAETGERLWEAAVGRIIAAPVTYEVDGVQFVSVLAGWGGAYATTAGAGGARIERGRVLSFAIGGQARVAPAEATIEPAAPEPISFTASPEQIAAGATGYAASCSVCHGPDAVSGGVLPDLRLAAPEVFGDFHDIVLGGARLERGMPSFELWLDRQEVDAIRAYVLHRRSELTR